MPFEIINTPDQAMNTRIVSKNNGPWHVVADSGWYTYGYLYYRTICGRKISARRNVGVIERTKEHNDLRWCRQCQDKETTDATI